ncbi:hypothetical protein HPB47_010945 [Ixodes persulcatus]|uniref:Uncharacterized protein n=1 Tax=Ixodes persulcatus TaxID=34615 RepID=A0AC60NXN6_IXOPE|nr:hypothetical protein HPB47_010945 [Ixodes persulcatus]
MVLISTEVFSETQCDYSLNTWPLTRENIRYAVGHGLIIAEMGTGDLRLIKVDVPPNALLGGGARLQCRFKLGNTPLYSVKWYKEDQEFFRYVPSDHPPKNVFPLKGVTVNVCATARSRIMRYGRHLIKKICWESTGQRVVLFPNSSLPKDGPKIRGIQKYYDVGDAVDINCYSPESQPVVSFRWFLNDSPAEPPIFEISNLATLHENGLESSASRLRFIIREDQFLNGSASIKCVAEVPDVYMKANETIIHRRPDSVDAKTPTESTDDECLLKMISVLRKVWTSYQ